MVIGRLTRDPDARNTPQGSAVSSFSVATNFTWTEQQGQKQEKVEFHNIVAWRKLAEICNQYLKKGSRVFVEGRLQTRSWNDPSGVTKYRTEIVAENMLMLDGRSSGGMGSSGGMSGSSGLAGSSSGGAARSASTPAMQSDDVALPPSDSGPSSGPLSSPSSSGAPADDEIKIENIPF